MSKLSRDLVDQFIVSQRFTILHHPHYTGLGKRISIGRKRTRKRTKYLRLLLSFFFNPVLRLFMLLLRFHFRSYRADLDLMQG
jgi:hypothetical protein